MFDATARLDALFKAWEARYTARQVKRLGFHKDGIIKESRFLKERQRVLFVMKEPNMSGHYEQYRYRDLREMFGQERLGKSIDVNLALWTRLIRVRNARYKWLSKNEAGDQLERVAVMNLKKFGGAGTADHVAIALQAWHDRAFILKEIGIIAPDIIVACGDEVYNLLWCLLRNDIYSQPGRTDFWSWKGKKVIHANHPSVRPVGAKKALKTLAERLDRLQPFLSRPRRPL